MRNINQLDANILFSNNQILSNNDNFYIKLNNNEYISEHDLAIMIITSVLGIIGQLPPINSTIQNTILDLFGVLGCQKNQDNTYSITDKDEKRVLEHSKRIIKIGINYFNNRPNCYGYVKFGIHNNHLRQTIYVKDNISKINFENTMFHEIHHFIYNIIKFIDYKGDIDLGDTYQMLHNEFLTRVHTANHSMLRHNTGSQNRGDTWSAIGSRHGQDRYAQSTRLAEHYIASRNMIYNIFVQYYGSDPKYPKNKNIKEPGYTMWSKIVQASNNYLFYMNNKSGLIDFLNIFRKASKQSSPKEVLQHLRASTFSHTSHRLVQEFYSTLPK